MSTLTHRERVIRALSRAEPDRVPVDLAGSAVTGINVAAYTNLVRHLALGDGGEVQVDRRGRTALPCEAILQRFDVDFRRIPLGKPETVRDEEIDERSYRDEWGVLWARPEGGHFINRGGPFQKTEPTLRDLERHRWPVPDDPGRLRGLRERALRLRQTTDYALVLSLPYSVVRECQRVRGFAEWMEDLLANPLLAEALMEHALRVAAGTATAALAAVGDLVDVVMFQDDLGFQDRAYLRPELYRQRVKPYHRRLVEAIRSKTRAKVVLHSDGSVYSLIPDFIDIGIDALNPIQVSAKNMDSRRLKAEFGAHLAFWGAIDTQRALPMGSPDDVRQEVKRRIQDLAPGGGYVVASVHNIQADVPPENIVAMFDAAREYGRYPEPARG